MFLVGPKVFTKLSCASEHRKRDLERLEIQHVISWSKSVLLSLVVLLNSEKKRPGAS